MNPCDFKVQSPKPNSHLYYGWSGCMFGGWWLKLAWIGCKWANGWWGGQVERKNIEVKGAQLGFLGLRGSSKAKVKQTRVWVHEVSWSSFTRLMHSQWLDIRVPQEQRQGTNSNDDLYKSQRTNVLGLRSMDDQMNKQSFQ